jgi:hypothetical protein|tara:strand:- start:358 stop:510 length:153 start_codon:yes stop_codon:yes gene_type:complete
MKRGYSEPGLIMELDVPKDRDRIYWVCVFWPDYGISTEKKRDLEVISESR